MLGLPAEVKINIRFFYFSSFYVHQAVLKGLCCDRLSFHLIFFSLNCFIFFPLKDINQHVLILTLSMTLFLSCLMNVTFIFRKILNFYWEELLCCAVI